MLHRRRRERRGLPGGSGIVSLVAFCWGVESNDGRLHIDRGHDDRAVRPNVRQVAGVLGSPDLAERDATTRVEGDDLHESGCSVGGGGVLYQLSISLKIKMPSA